MKELSLHITDVCHFRCQFCVWGETLVQAGDPVPLRDLERFLRENRDRGFERVNLHGGEPTLRRDLFGLLAKIRNLGSPTVSIQTNGWALANRRFTERLMEAGVSLFVISVHGPTPEVHDVLSGHPESLRRPLEGMEHVRALGQKIRTNSVIVRSSYVHLDAIAELVTGAGAAHVNFSGLMPTGRASAAEESMMVTYREVEPYVRRALEVAERRGAVATLEGFPRCAVPGHAERCLHPRSTRTCRGFLS